MSRGYFYSIISRSQQELRQQTRDRDKLESSQHALDQAEMGPIRIRNLEDLIR